MHPNYHLWAEPIRAMYDAWDHPHVSRPDFKKFSGNSYDGRSLANADCAGVGPKGRFKIGRVTCYPKGSACDFLAGKFKALDQNQGQGQGSEAA